jgi:hypothetical protein
MASLYYILLSTRIPQELCCATDELGFLRKWRNDPCSCLMCCVALILNGYSLHRGLVLSNGPFRVQYLCAFGLYPKLVLLPDHTSVT